MTSTSSTLDNLSISRSTVRLDHQIPPPAEESRRLRKIRDQEKIMCDVPGASSPRAIRCYQCHLKKCRHHHPDHERSSVEKNVSFMAHATSNKDMYEILSSSQDKRLTVKEEYTFIPPAPTATSFRRWSMSASESPTTDPQSWLWQSRQVSASQSSEQRRPRSRFLSVDSSVSSERQVALNSGCLLSSETSTRKMLSTFARKKC